MKARVLVPGIVALAAAAIVASLPPKSVPLPPEGRPAGDVRGVVHVHTRRSDGGGTIEDVALAAARAGLGFVVVTDHGDGTRRPDPPTYRHGVLVIDAAEVTTFDGHVLALGIGQSPYRLGGRGVDVVEDINRLGGFAVAAHVDSPKRSLRWRAWDAALTGFEWLNGDSEWRDESRAALLPLLVQYPFRAPEALARILDRPETTLTRWDTQLATRRLTTIAAADAHARIGGGEEEDPRWWRKLSLPIPGYQALFDTFSVVATGVALTGDASIDAAALLASVREGRTYSVVDALASPGWLRFRAVGPAGSAGPGSSLPGAGGTVRFEIDVPAATATRVRLLRAGVLVRETAGASLRVDVPDMPAAYRVEVTRDRAPGTPPVPWIVSNPIFVGRDDTWGRPRPSVQVEAATAEPMRLVRASTPGEWAVEQSEASRAAVDVVGEGTFTAALFRYALSGTESSGPFAAAVLPVAGMGGANAIRLQARADRPTRVSVELRGVAAGTEGRWRHSVYLDGTSRSIAIPIDALAAVSAHQAPAPDLAAVRSVLIVVDGVNTASGTAGQIWIESADLVRRPSPSGADGQQ